MDKRQTGIIPKTILLSSRELTFNIDIMTKYITFYWQIIKLRDTIGGGGVERNKIGSVSLAKRYKETQFQDWGLNIIVDKLSHIGNKIRIKLNYLVPTHSLFAACVVKYKIHIFYLWLKLLPNKIFMRRLWPTKTLGPEVMGKHRSIKSNKLMFIKVSI